MGTQSTVLVWVVVLTAIVAGAWFGYQRFTAHRLSTEAARLAQVLALGPTSRVGDVGAGGGAYTLELASHIVPRGHVFATEIEQEAVADIRAAASAERLENVTVIRAAEASANLPPACCDAIFLRGVYHHITKPVETNRTLRVALRPDGKLAVIDFVPSWFLSTFFPVRGVPGNRGGHGIPPGVVVFEMQQAGLTLVNQQDDWIGGQYCLVFQTERSG